jgi:cobalt-zinc-cadmium efflux system outer membrane protein
MGDSFSRLIFIFMVILSLVLPCCAIVSADTLRLPAESAFVRAVAHAPELVAARARDRAAVALVRVAGEFRNPLFTVTEENLGAQRRITGQGGLAGLEGQATLSGLVPIGGDRGAATSVARANRLASSAVIAFSDAAVREELALAVAVSERDAALARHAREEQVVLSRLATAMTERAGAGRSSGGEAARSRIEAALSVSSTARRAALADTSAATVARLLGTDAIVRVDADRCQAEMPVAALMAIPEVSFADARAEAARQQVRLARARAIPDLQPQVGWRRTAGFSGLLLGVGFDLPLFNAGGSSIAAARAEADAAAADRELAQQRVDGVRRAAMQGLARLDSAGTAFGPDWRTDLERAVNSAEARLNSGEGTLVEYLDARRARMLAMDEYEAWRAERRRARTLVARYRGNTIDGTVLCDDPR